MVPTAGVSGLPLLHSLGLAFSHYTKWLATSPSQESLAIRIS